MLFPRFEICKEPSTDAFGKATKDRTFAVFLGRRVVSSYTCVQSSCLIKAVLSIDRYAYIYIHTHIHTHIHTYIHT